MKFAMKTFRQSCKQLGCKIVSKTYYSKQVELFPLLLKESGSNMEYKLQPTKGTAGLGAELEQQVYLVLNMHIKFIWSTTIVTLFKVQNDIVD